MSLNPEENKTTIEKMKIETENNKKENSDPVTVIYFMNFSYNYLIIL